MLQLTLLLAFPAQQSAPDFDWKLLSGETFRGPLIGWTERELITADAGGQRAMPLAALQSVRRSGSPRPGPPKAEHLLLANGDRVPGTLTAFQDSRLSFRPGGQLSSDPWELPSGVVDGWWRRLPEDTANSDAWGWAWVHEPPRFDRVTLRNGDSAEGIWQRFAEETVVFKAAGEVLRLPRERIAALRLVRKEPAPQPAKAGARVLLRDGTRVTLAQTQFAEGRVRGLTGQGLPVTFSPGEVLLIEPVGPERVELSSLVPSRETVTPFLDTRWPAVRDGSAARRWLRLGGGLFDRGLGTHSRCELSYDLAGRYSLFTATVGLDDQAGRHGHALAKVLVDGRERWSSPELTPHRPPAELRIDLQGARELTLLVDFGQGGDASDHVNWVDAWLIKSPAP